MQNLDRKYRNASAIGDLLGNVIGEEGIKTDVQVKLAPITIPVIALAIIFGVIVGGLAKDAISKAIKG